MAFHSVNPYIPNTILLSALPSGDPPDPADDGVAVDRGVCARVGGARPEPEGGDSEEVVGAWRSHRGKDHGAAGVASAGILGDVPPAHADQGSVAYKGEPVLAARPDHGAHVGRLEVIRLWPVVLQSSISGDAHRDRGIVETGSYDVAAKNVLMY